MLPSPRLAVLLSSRLRLPQCRMGSQIRTRSSGKLQIFSRRAGSAARGAIACGVGVRAASRLWVRAARGVRDGTAPALGPYDQLGGSQRGAAPTPGAQGRFGARSQRGVAPSPGAQGRLGARARGGAGTVARDGAGILARDGAGSSAAECKVFPSSFRDGARAPGPESRDCLSRDCL